MTKLEKKITNFCNSFDNAKKIVLPENDPRSKEYVGGADEVLKAIIKDIGDTPTPVENAEDFIKNIIIDLISYDSLEYYELKLRINPDMIEICRHTDRCEDYMSSIIFKISKKDIFMEAISCMESEGFDDDDLRINYINEDYVKHTVLFKNPINKSLVEIWDSIPYDVKKMYIDILYEDDNLVYNYKLMEGDDFVSTKHKYGLEYYHMTRNEIAKLEQLGLDNIYYDYFDVVNECYDGSKTPIWNEFVLKTRKFLNGEITKKEWGYKRLGNKKRI